MTASTAITKLEALLLGRAAPFGPAGELSAIQKRPVSGALALDHTGLSGDEHAEHCHGGADKALLHYPAEHYQMWRRRLPEFNLTPGGLGENISTFGMTEETVCIGDRYRVVLPSHLAAETTRTAETSGTAEATKPTETAKPTGANSQSEVVLELGEPRQPCWKLGYNAGLRELPLLIQQQAATGWYYRVITAGPIAAGATLELVSRPHPDWPLARVIRGFYESPLDPEFLASLIALPELGAGWRAVAAQRLETGITENWEGRLYGPFAPSAHG